METPIKPGKYKMRNGGQAIVAAIAPENLNAPQPVVGWFELKNSDSWTSGHWNIDGTFNMCRSASKDDLISPWIDPPVFNHWYKVPWAKCVYRFGSNWYATSNAASWHSESENDPYNALCVILTEDCPKWDGHDKDSIILRPKNV